MVMMAKIQIKHLLMMIIVISLCIGNFIEELGIGHATFALIVGFHTKPFVL